MKKNLKGGACSLDGTSCNSREVDTTSETDNKAKRTTLEQIVKHEAAPNAAATPDGFVENITRHETHCRCGKADCEYAADFLSSESGESVTEVLGKDLDNPAFIQDDFPLNVDTTAHENAAVEAAADFDAADEAAYSAAHSEAWNEEWAEDYDAADENVTRDGIRRSYPSELAREAFAEAGEEYGTEEYAVHIGNKRLGETYPRAAALGDGSVAGTDAFEAAEDNLDADAAPAPHPTRGYTEAPAFEGEDAEFAEDEEYTEAPAFEGEDAEFAEDEVETPYTDTCEYCMISPDPETLGDDDSNIAVTMQS